MSSTQPNQKRDDREDLEAVDGHRPTEATVPAAAYLRENTQIVKFVAFVAQLAKHADKVQTIARNALREPGDGDADVPAPEDRTQKQLGQFRRLIAELVLTRGVDNYLSYVSDLLALVFAERPETLRSGEEVRVDFILGFDSITELQQAIAERRVERLAYRGMRELVDWVETTLGFVLVSDADQLKAIERFVEQRNLIVHNRGIIDRRYLSKLGSGDGDLGDALEVTHAVDALAMMDRAVAETDKRAAAKWGLECVPFSEANSVS